MSLLDPELDLVVDSPDQPAATIVRSSLMPDAYLYRNGFGAGMNGEVTLGATPVSHGNFSAFSRFAEPGEEHPSYANPFGDCDSSTGASGNPWGFTAPRPLQSPGRNPDSAHFCVDRSVTPGASHGSR